MRARYLSSLDTVMARDVSRVLHDDALHGWILHCLQALSISFNILILLATSSRTLPSGPGCLQRMLFKIKLMRPSQTNGIS
jgi:hypothetical protein